MVIFMKIGDVCSIQKGSRINRKQNIEGNIPVYGFSKNPRFFTNEFNREGRTCKINKGKSGNYPNIIILNEIYFLNDEAFTIKSNNNELTDEYLWFYLQNNENLIQYIGTGIPIIDMEHFRNIQIPVPSISSQVEITSTISSITSIQNQLNNQLNNYINTELENIHST